MSPSTDNAVGATTIFALTGPLIFPDGVLPGVHSGPRLGPTTATAPFQGATARPGPPGRPRRFRGLAPVPAAGVPRPTAATAAAAETAEATAAGAAIEAAQEAAATAAKGAGLQGAGRPVATGRRVGVVGTPPDVAGLLLPVAPMAARHAIDTAMAEAQVPVRPMDTIDVTVPTLGPLRRVEEPIAVLVGGHGLHGPEAAPVMTRHVGDAAATGALLRGARVALIGPAVVTTVRVSIPEGPAPAGATTRPAAGDAAPGVPPRGA